MCIVLSALAFGQSDPYVTVTGVLQGPNGLPVSNNILSFAPTQNFFVAGNFPACNSYILQVNTTSLLTCGDTINFNSILPAAPANGINVLFQTSKTGTTDYISAALVGDGNAAHCLLGTGVFGNCTTISLTAGGGLVLSGSSLGLLTSCTNGQVLQWNGSAWLCATVGGGGGGGTPGGAPTQIQTQLNGTTFGAIVNQAPGYALVSEGTNTDPAFQQKPVYDVRDYGLACDGSTNDTAALIALRTAIGSTPATIAIPVDGTHPGPCELGGMNIPASFDFSGGGAIGLIANPATPGTAAVVQTGVGVPYTGNSCTASVPNPPTAGNAIVMELIYEFGSGTVPNLPTDSANDSFNLLLQSNLSFQSNSASWAAPAITGGSASQTVTVTLAGSSTHGVCFAQEVSGLGTGIAVDAGSFSYAGGSSPYSGPMTATTTLLSGDFVLAYGGQGTNNVTCTQGGGFTQPASTAGNVNGSCFQYLSDSSAGSVTPSQAISTTTTDYWVYNVVGIRPGSSVVHPEGGIVDPDLHKIWYNATGSSGAVSFFGNLALTRVYPEWWGASPSASAATNTPAIQAAIAGAFNNGGAAYNKTLDLGRGIYNINAETKWYDVRGNQASRFQVDCGSAGGINQTTANDRIMDSQSMAYGRFDNCQWSSSATDTQATALLDIDYNGVTTLGDGAPQFLDFYSNSFAGNNLRAIGVLGAKSGGGAQFSNINFYDPEFIGFTQAAYQIGTPATPADNAIENYIWGGDMQGNPQYGVAVYGGNVEEIGTSNENGFSTTSNEGPQSGYDVYCAFNQGPCVMQWVRSESMHLIACETCIVEHSYTIDQGLFPTPGGSDPVGAIIDGHNEGIVWDGRYYKVTGDNGPFGGAGTTTAPLTASSGSTTTIVDTNETVAGSVTNGIFVNNENLVQTGTSSTATLIGGVGSTYTVAGNLTSGIFIYGETVTQTSTGATGPANSAITSTTLKLQSLTGVADATHTWVGGTSGAIFTPTATPVASATTMLITAATGSPNGTGTWVGQTSGAIFTPTGAPVNQANWTTNQFVGMAVADTGGINEGCYGVVTANGTQTITLSAGWITQYSQLACTAPAANSSFIVTLNYGSASTLYSCATGSTSACASTGMTLAVVTDDGVGACNGCVSAGVQADDVSVPGLRWKISSNSDSTLKSVTVGPSLWLDTTSDPQGCCSLDRDWDVRRGQTIQIPAVQGPNQPGTYYTNWTLPSITGISYTGPFGDNVGGRAYVFTAGTVNGSPNRSSSDTAVGGRTDPGCGTDITRCHLEIWPSIGPPTPVGTNQNGNNMVIDCGNSTGSGTPGSCYWYVSSAGASGTTPNGGGSSPSWAMTLNTNGLILSSIAASTSPICPNGTGGALTTVGCSGGSGGGLSGMTGGQIPLAATSTTVTSSIPLQGTDVAILTAGTISGLANTLCVDSNGGATTVGCSNAGLSGMTTGQVPIAASASTITSSKALNGSGTGIVTGPSSSTTTGHVTTFTGSSGQIQDSGTALSSLLTSSGVSGMTGGQIPVAATATTITSSEALAGTGAGIVTGPVSGTVAGHVVVEVGTNGQIQDSGTAISSFLTSSGVSGMTASQVPIAATATTITSSKALSGSGPGITTGPASGVVSGDFAQFTGTGGQISDTGISVTAGADTVLGNPTGSSATAGYTTNPVVGTMTALTQFSVGAPTSITCPSGGSCFTAGEASTSGFAGASSTDAIDFNGLSTVVSLNGGSPYIPAMLYPLAGGSSTTSVASTMATLDQTGVSTANSGTPQNVLASTPAAGHYRIFVYVDQSAGCTTLGLGALTVSVAWTDATHARVSGNQTLTVATADTGTGDWVQITQDLWAAASSAITVTDTYTACTTGTWTYDQHAIVERVE